VEVVFHIEQPTKHLLSKGESRKKRGYVNRVHEKKVSIGRRLRGPSKEGPAVMRVFEKKINAKRKVKSDGKNPTERARREGKNNALRRPSYGSMRRAAQ